jgi:predicted SnoaL-like aldol condensation-catalyzing enzyme
MSDSESSRALVRTNIDLVETALRVVFSEHRIDQVDMFFADDFVQHSPYAAPGGKEELKQWWAGIVDSIPDVTTATTQVLGRDDDVVVFRKVSGTIVKDLPAFGIKGRGHPVEFHTADIFRVKEDKIVAHWEVADTGPFVLLAMDTTQHDG